MLKTIIFGGHNSKFGFACIKQLIQSNYLGIDMVVIADFNRWNKFSCSLNLIEKTSYNWSLRKRNKRQLSNLKQLLKQYPNIQLQVIHDANTDKVIEFLKSYDLAIATAFPQIFSKKIIETPKKGVINLHPSWLPRCRGANPVYWTIFSQEDYGGLSAHFMETEIDKGPIIARRKITFDKESITYENLYQKVIDQIPDLIKDIEKFFKMDQTPIEQIEDDSTYFRSDRLIYNKIFWESETNEMISAKIRAGGAFTFRNNKLIYIVPPVIMLNKTKFVSNNYDNRIAAGTIIHHTDKFLWIKTQKGYLKTKYNLKKDSIDRMMDICKFLSLGFLIYRIPLFDQQRIIPGQILS